MNTRLTTLERAFELAKSGKYEKLEEVSKALDKEGYTDARAQLFGPSLKRQLAALVKDARRAQS